MSVIKNRELCYLILGFKQVLLSKLLGVSLPAKKDYTVIIDTNSRIKLSIPQSTILPTTLNTLKKTLFTPKNNTKKSVESLAFINKSPTATYADCVMFYRILSSNEGKEVVKLLVVFIQEKQSIKARQSAANNQMLPVQHTTATSIQEEYAKCKPPSDMESLFIFCSDSGEPDIPEGKFSESLLLFDEVKNAALGTIASDIRNHQLISWRPHR